MEEAQGFLSVGVGETSATNVRSLSMFYHDAKHVSRGTKPHTICSSYSFAILKPQVFSESSQAILTLWKAFVHFRKCFKKGL